MGEARTRKRLLTSLLKESPNCVFCGGETIATGAFPQDFLDAFPPSQTLSAGRKTTFDQFEYSSQMSADNSFGVHFAAFRQSFAVFAAVSEDPKTIKSVESEGDWEVFTPIDFKEQLKLL